MKSSFIVSTVFSALVGLASMGCNPALESGETDEADHLQIETSSSAWGSSPPLPPKPPFAGNIGIGGSRCDGDGLIGHERRVSCPSERWACKRAEGARLESCVPSDACVANVNGRTTETPCPECQWPTVVRFNKVCVDHYRFDSEGRLVKFRECHDVHRCWYPEFPAEPIETE